MVAIVRLFCLLIITVCSDVVAPVVAGQQGTPIPVPVVPATTHYDFNVTVAQKAPDCFGELIYRLFLRFTVEWHLSLLLLS